MIPTRVMPILLLKGTGLVKTESFQRPRYLGDPRNAVRIFNEKQVDELVLLDILATPNKLEPQFELIREIVSEAFMPIAYGGGLRSLDHCRRIFTLGVEKIVLNTAAFDTPTIVQEAATEFGAQSVVVAIDVKRTRDGAAMVYTHGGRVATGMDPVVYAQRMQAAGAGELILTSIDRDGTMRGYDLELVRSVTSAVRVPVVASGGAGSVADIGEVIRVAGASAAGAGSMFVYHGKHKAVLITFPNSQQLAGAIADGKEG